MPSDLAEVLARMSDEQAGDPELALSTGESALATWPDDPRLLVACAAAARSCGRLDVALGHAADAVAVGGSHAIPHAVFADVLWAAGRVDEAAYAAARAVDLAPANFHHHVRLGELASLQPDGADLAWQAAQRAVTLAPHEPMTHLLVVRLALPQDPRYAHDRQLDTAERAAREAIRLEPTLPEAHAALASVQVLRPGAAGGLAEICAAVAAGGGAAPLAICHALIGHAVQQLAAVLVLATLPVTVQAPRVVCAAVAVVLLGFVGWLGSGVLGRGRVTRVVVGATLAGHPWLAVSVALVLTGLVVCVLGLVAPLAIPPVGLVAAVWAAALSAFAVSVGASRATLRAAGLT